MAAIVIRTDAIIIHGENIDMKTAETFSKKYKNSFQYGVLLEIDSKMSHTVKATKNEKYKFHCLPYGKNQFLIFRQIKVSSFHQ